MDSKAFGGLCFALGAFAAQGAHAAPEDDAAHVVRSASGYASERGADALREIGTLEEVRIEPGELVLREKGGSSYSASSVYDDHWIYDATVEAFFDADEDGYHRYVRVTFDVDSYYDPAWVFAQVYLSADGEHWELLHETDEFRVDGATPSDAYEVETELVSGYPPGSYDLLVEIYDADTAVFVDEFGPAQSSAFSLLPLEDYDHDVRPAQVIVRERGGGGAASMPGLVLLAGIASIRLARRARRV